MKNKNWTLSEANKLGFVETEKGLVRAEKLVDKMQYKNHAAPTRNDNKLIDNAMTKKTNATLSQFSKLGYVEKDGKLIKAASLVDKKPIEINLSSVDTKKFTPEQIYKMYKGTPNQVFSNKKVRNATKTVVDGVKFDSLLELHMYELLKGANIEFEFQKVYLLQEKFRYGKKAVRAVTLTVDFFLPKYNMLIDTKGVQTQQGALRWKLLKWSFIKKLGCLNDLQNPYQHKPPIIEMPKNKQEAELLLNRLLYDDKYKQ